MPFYTYICFKCSHEFDEFHKISERNAPCGVPCPKCNEDGVNQKIGGAAFSYSAAKMPENGKLREKLQQIHENTPGSRLDKCSTITKI